jgi:hypothetical protein
MVAAKTAPELRHSAVGLGPVIFQSLTVVAPAAGVATALPRTALDRRQDSSSGGG